MYAGLREVNDAAGALVLEDRKRGAVAEVEEFFESRALG